MNNNQDGALTLHDMLPVIEEKLSSGGEVTFKPNGISMLPLIRPGKDAITLKGIKSRPKIGDVIFYKRKTGQLVLHRIVGEDADGYILCGDNQCYLEHGITDDMLIGVLTSFVRSESVIKSGGILYGLYKKQLPLRRFYLRGKGFIRRVINKIKRSVSLR